ncbi:MAG: hypothetical protein IRY92_00645 [Dactylosporangium sp.]|nr:hypothetical protein [Dactylosporangium sp.]
MTGGLVGANPDQLDELAARLNSSAEALESIRFTLRASLGRVEWPGPDGDQFRHDWDHHHGPALAAAVTMLREAARVARINATEQRVASRDGTGLLPPGIVAAGVSLVEGMVQAVFGGSDGPNTLDERFGWWSGLSPEERAELIRREPERIGSMDGIPAADRDAANRILLERAAAGGNEAAIKLKERLDGRDDLYLLGFDESGDGRAIVAVGNPDTADHVATYVPGKGTDLADVTNGISDMERLRKQAMAADPQAIVATVYWLDYDAPNGYVEALRAGNAENASSALNSFQEGLRVTHQGEPSHNTIIGHSYGGKVVGIADREHGLPVDDIVFLGAPDVGVDKADQLSVGRDHVWATAAPGDPIDNLSDIGSEVPTEGGFGAQGFTSDDVGFKRAHSSYLWDGSSSLKNLGCIVVGQQSKVF